MSLLDGTSQRSSPSPEKTYPTIAKIIKAADDLLHLRGGYSPGRVLVITIGGIILAEVIAMIIVYYNRHWTYLAQVVLDATIMTLIIFPILYSLSFKPLLLQIEQRSRSESIIQTRLRLMQYANQLALDELLQFVLDQVQDLTGSKIGFFHFLEGNQTELWLQAWSTNTIQNMCKAEGKNSHYDVEKAGVWADAVRLRQPVIHNNYASVAHRKGMPEGHASVTREIVVPILRDKKVVAILGLGNKPQDYTEADKDLISTLADFAWDVVENKRAEIALRQSEEKFRTLAEWTYDWELWKDPQGNIVYTSPSCERITGYTPAELVADPELLAHIVHPEDRQIYMKHQKNSHNSSAGLMVLEFRIIHRDGSEHWIEHNCRPLFSPGNEHLGRRISNREITERKLTEQKISEQKQKELTLNKTIRTIQEGIARDLHDTLGQNIGFLRMNLSHLLESQWNDQVKIKDKIQTMTEVADESYDLIRAMLGVLRNGESYDPISLFSRYANQISERNSFQIWIRNQGNLKPLTPHQIQQLFYIFREALSNIEKYAGACHVLVEFYWEEEMLKLIISDDGCGFDPNGIPTEGHYGIKFMRERSELIGGSFVLQSAPGTGTTKTITVPYE